MKYYPVLKTSQSEIRALANTLQSDSKQTIIPLLMLTKPRISDNSSSSLQNHIKRILSKLGKNRKVVIGITDDEKFQDASLSQFLYDSAEGYYAWQRQLARAKGLNNNIIPCVIGNPNANNLKNYKLQIQQLAETFSEIAIKLPAIIEDDFSEIIKILKFIDFPLMKHGNLVYLDFGYIESLQFEKFMNMLPKLNETIEDDNSIKSTFIILFSSCPSTFPIGKDRENCKIQEVPMLEYSVLEKIISVCGRLKYGDYAYIHPKQSESGGIVWYPRIDYPVQQGNHCYYARYFNKEITRKDRNFRIITHVSNEEAYIALSKKFANELFFKDDFIKSWGREEISSNTSSSPENIGKSPSHYIAVRSNIHMTRILSILNTVR